MTLNGAALDNAVQAMHWLDLQSAAEDLQRGADVKTVAEILRETGEECAARVVLAAAADNVDRIIGRPLVHVVPSRKHPAAVFRTLDHAERYGAAAGEGRQAEHAVVCDDETAEALIDEARGGTA